MPRIPRYKLDPIVQSNIARLQNAQRPLVKAANKRLERVVRDLSNFTVEPRPDPIRSNPFKRWLADSAPNPGRNLFAPAQPRPSTISLEEYRSGARSSRDVTEALASETESLAGEESDPNVPPSVNVSNEDLNICTEGLFEDVSTGSDANLNTVDITPPARIPPASLIFGQNVPCSSFLDLHPLPDNLFDSESGRSSPELQINIDTDDEQLEAGDAPSPTTVTKLMVQIDLQQIEWDNTDRSAAPATEGEPPKVPEANPIPACWANFQRYPFNDYSPSELGSIGTGREGDRRRRDRNTPPRCLPLFANLVPDPDICETYNEACLTPRVPILEPYLTQHFSKSVDKRRRNLRLRRDAWTVIIAHRAAANPDLHQESRELPDREVLETLRQWIRETCGERNPKRTERNQDRHRHFGEAVGLLRERGSIFGRLGSRRNPANRAYRRQQSSSGAGKN